MVEEGKAYQYAKWCITEDNKKVPRYVKIQAKRWMDIVEGKHPDAYVDENAYEKICTLLKLIVHPDLRCSMYDGMENYAWFFITATLCTICRPESRFYEIAEVKHENLKIRFYVTALLEICRKNFKTFTAAVVFIILMLTEPDFSRFFSVAPDLSLSSELKNAIRKIIKVSPALYDDEDPAFKILRSQILCLLLISSTVHRLLFCHAPNSSQILPRQICFQTA